jgi:hypothetical protein
MDLIALTAFAWNAVSSGVIGNAAYDGMKQLLGNGFVRLAGYAENGQRESFETALQAILETNDALRKGVAQLAASGTITTGNIKAGGNVIVGDHNSIG